VQGEFDDVVPFGQVKTTFVQPMLFAPCTVMAWPAVAGKVRYACWPGPVMVTARAEPW
jgi:hypothetical protein